MNALVSVSYTSLSRITFGLSFSDTATTKHLAPIVNLPHCNNYQKIYFRSECVPSSLNPHACMCNSTHCDDIPSISWCPNESQLHLYVTSESGARFSPSIINFNPNENNSTDLTIDIDPCKTHQTIIGFGGAMTDSAALMISCLSDSARKNLMDSYFDCDKGTGYDLLRVPLGASDYSESLYTYDDTSEPDMNLEHFGLNEMDKKYKVRTGLLRQ